MIVITQLSKMPVEIRLVVLIVQNHICVIQIAVLRQDDQIFRCCNQSIMRTQEGTHRVLVLPEAEPEMS